MKSKVAEREFTLPWDFLKEVLKNSQIVVRYFPYFDNIEERNGELYVRFKVPKFLFNFGFEFKLEAGFEENKCIYTFKGDKGILTITFECLDNKLRVEASWSGFGEFMMGKNLEIFANGIADSIKRFCQSQAEVYEKCEICKAGEKITAHIKELTPSTLPSLLMRLCLSSGSADIEIRGESVDKEESFKAYVKDGKLTRFVFISKSKVIDFEMNVDLKDLEKERDVFRDVPISGAFKVTVSPFKF
ncbi:hypothetical protein E3E31_00685 [Thermococcus sp. M39]|uniref:hypothetical protein n=1 Tax=unclassified Thermococcus TaxID=2627626 RepID=UPI00143B80E1|nr:MULTISPECIES: hypothetical protein [unclassified Thermococcus]NJE07070.1 hypothetical protein [Thermococcus sp. M39]NJE13608.1 hypothetical protein [Thermococcus sp. LS2]